MRHLYALLNFSHSLPFLSDVRRRLKDEEFIAMGKTFLSALAVADDKDLNNIRAKLLPHTMSFDPIPPSWEMPQPIDPSPLIMYPMAGDQPPMAETPGNVDTDILETPTSHNSEHQSAGMLMEVYSTPSEYPVSTSSRIQGSLTHNMADGSIVSESRVSDDMEETTFPSTQNRKTRPTELVMQPRSQITPSRSACAHTAPPCLTPPSLRALNMLSSYIDTIKLSSSVTLSLT
ncbi:hypothetical protein K469DRAFT_688599 [Zopfia rhizophila CBS 207.26]|uniref:Uncharacterized protein n=1 Tax=Zopfia rhizophila CBS 207.26 TaxID=1314779 RepID=A0A6A6E018_9PEZI|nr:hypothetical protein K469DRAFT_688599 [Zopfia rhizophila CBS 207.26]